MTLYREIFPATVKPSKKQFSQDQEEYLRNVAQRIVEARASKGPGALKNWFTAQKTSRTLTSADYGPLMRVAHSADSRFWTKGEVKSTVSDVNKPQCMKKKDQSTWQEVDIALTKIYRQAMVLAGSLPDLDDAGRANTSAMTTEGRIALGLHEYVSSSPDLLAFNKCKILHRQHVFKQAMSQVDDSLRGFVNSTFFVDGGQSASEVQQQLYTKEDATAMLERLSTVMKEYQGTWEGFYSSPTDGDSADALESIRSVEGEDNYVLGTLEFSRVVMHARKIVKGLDSLKNAIVKGKSQWPGEEVVQVEESVENEETPLAAWRKLIENLEGFDDDWLSEQLGAELDDESDDSM